MKVPKILVSSRIFSSSILIPYALLLGLAVGLGSAYAVLRGDYPVGGVAIGPWRAWPKVGTSEADPYARIIMARRSEVPLAISEGLALKAVTDSEGRKFDARCRYRIGSVVPAARLWTLAAYDGTDHPVRSELGRSHFTSSEVLRNADGGFSIRLARDVQPGNWIQLPADGPFSLVLRLYDMPGAAGAAALDAGALPAIERLGCGA